jgi:hypothetical protein
MTSAVVGSCLARTSPFVSRDAHDESPLSKQERPLVVYANSAAAHRATKIKSAAGYRTATAANAISIMMAVCLGEGSAPHQKRRVHVARFLASGPIEKLA